MSDASETSPPPQPASPAQGDAPPSLLASAVLLGLSLALLGSHADEISDAIRGPTVLRPAQAPHLAAPMGRWVQVEADEVAGTSVEQTTLRVLKIGLVPLPAGREGAQLALVRSGQAHVGAYLAAGVAPESLTGKQLRGTTKPWPAGISRPEEVSPWVLDTTEDEPGWGMGLVVAAFATYCAFQLVTAARRRLTGR